ncbi:MAG: hypothetical protein R3E93_01050 [Thiothrix sp.]
MLTRLFCELDDFCQDFLPTWHFGLRRPTGKHPRRHCGLTDSEIMTILVYYHQSDTALFKWFYQQHVLVYLKGHFPGLAGLSPFC